MAGALKVWDGTQWQTASATGANQSVFVGPSPPPGSPRSGDLWYDSDEASPLDSVVSVAKGGTGATTAIAARTNLAVPAIGQSGSTAGAPITGTWARGDQWVDSLGALWICTIAGSPGTWTSPARGFVAGTLLGGTLVQSFVTTSGYFPSRFDLTLTTNATRRYEIRLTVLASVATATQYSIWSLNLYIDGVDTARTAQITAQNSAIQCFSTAWSMDWQPTTGSHTMRLYGYKFFGDGQLGIDDSSAIPYQLRVYDVGGR